MSRSCTPLRDAFGTKCQSVRPDSRRPQPTLLLGGVERVEPGDCRLADRRGDGPAECRPAGRGDDTGEEEDCRAPGEAVVRRGTWIMEGMEVLRGGTAYRLSRAGRDRGRGGPDRRGRARADASENSVPTPRPTHRRRRGTGSGAAGAGRWPPILRRRSARRPGAATSGCGASRPPRRHRRRPGAARRA